MTRPKVDPDKRQRTAQACDSCKRRKQKCNGLCPCHTCQKRNLTCTFGSNEPTSDEPSPAKRRLTESDVSVFGRGSAEASPRSQPQLVRSPGSARPRSTRWGSVEPEAAMTPVENAAAAAPSMSLVPVQLDDTQQKDTPMSRGTTQSGHDEEAVMYTYTRMLQDPSGRLLYVGDSATLSFLQLMRTIVESVDGPSPFTTDPRRHRILENSLRIPQGLRHTHLLPDQKTANVLVASFFINTQGLLEAFDRTAFYETLEASYLDPLNIDPSWLCLLNLVFAVGLVLACFAPGTFEADVIHKLRNDSLDRAEMFYLNAKALSDPITGFEDAGFWSIQALLLMTVYMLAVSKRNAAFALFGMAVRSAFALGLHREETMVIYAPQEREMRRNLWRSLFVFDRFLAASMGRPTAISEDDCSGDNLKGPEPLTRSSEDQVYSNIGPVGLQASVQSCHVIGVILRRVYQKRKISTRMAQEIADVCKLWTNALAPVLHWRQAASSSPSQGIAILHVNLIYCHSIILLTRPFFLFLLNTDVNELEKLSSSSSGAGGGGGNDGGGYHQQQQQRLRRPARRMEKFAEACVAASTHSIRIVQDAYKGGYLPRRNPFVIYFLFAAALIVLSNEFTQVYPSPNAIPCINSAIIIMTYCAETDPQAERLVYILVTFRDVINTRQSRHGPAPPAPHPSLLPPLSDDTYPNQMIAYQTKTEEGSPGTILPDTSWPRSGSFSAKVGNLTTPPPAGNSSYSEEHLGPDEAIDFDALWHWPSNNAPMAGVNPAFHSNVQVGPTEVAVPMFGMANNRK